MRVDEGCEDLCEEIVKFCVKCCLPVFYISLCEWVWVFSIAVEVLRG